MKGDDMETRREDAGVRNVVHIDRKIPLWGILGVIGVIALQAVLMYVAQREQGIAIQQLISNNSTLTVEVKEMRRENQQSELKNMERDMLVRDFDRRLRAMESSKSTPRP
jgi:hypothetical protein